MTELAEQIYKKVEGQEYDVKKELKKKEYLMTRNTARMAMQIEMTEALTGKTKE